MCTYYSGSHTCERRKFCLPRGMREFSSTWCLVCPFLSPGCLHASSEGHRVDIAATPHTIAIVV
eukprot:SAG31_NODE_2025_length_6642_cov_6.408681_8_plen_64_part_00